MGGSRRGKVKQVAGIGEEVVPGVLGVDASFEGVPYERNLPLGKRKWIPSGNLR